METATRANVRTRVSMNQVEWVESRVNSDQHEDHLSPEPAAAGEVRHLVHPSSACMEPEAACRTRANFDPVSSETRNGTTRGPTR